MAPVASAIVAMSCGGGAPSRPDSSPAGDAENLDASPMIPDAAPFRCIGGWPVAPAPNTKPSLSVTPSLLWSRQTNWRGPADSLALTADRVALSAGDKLFLFDHQGNLMGQFRSFAFEPLSRPTADPDGNLYVAGSSLYSVDATGGVRWSVAFGPPLVQDRTLAASIVLSPAGILYTAASDGYAYAVRAGDGTVVWKRFVGLHVGNPAIVSSGVGDSVVILSSETPDQFFDAATGEPHGYPSTRQGEPISAGMFGHGFGIVGTTANAYYDRFGIHVSSGCGEPRWSLPVTARS